ncbi:hypothetical protein [Streptomyces sp. NPDC001568]|uniref:hypothetical protein n=1 Tax=Streptomyces sp. NPDC001568 TaxID=3364588 RepID=UPI0036BA82ED
MEERIARYGELPRMPTPALVALYRAMGHLSSDVPLERWPREEVITAILDAESYARDHSSRGGRPTGFDRER